MTLLLKVQGLAKSYSMQLVLRDVNFSLEEGGSMSIIGPNGSGKSTLINILNLLEPPSKGTMIFKERDVLKEKNKWRIRRQMAVVFQKPVVFNTSVHKNITIGLGLRGVDKRESKEKADLVLEKFNLYKYRDNPARSLSGGEQQLLSIARAMALAPDLLILDEPTSNLDPVNSALIYEGLKEFEGALIIASPREDDELRGSWIRPYYLSCQGASDR